MRVGIISDHRIPAIKYGPRSLLRGLPSSSGAGLMRAGWIIDSHPGCYEWYRPFATYDIVVFVKSFSDECRRLALKVRKQCAKVVFDINVNYFESKGSCYYRGMMPEPGQIQAATEMLHLSDGVMAASEELRDVCLLRGGQAAWIPDNVKMDLVPSRRESGRTSDVLHLMWCGQAVKLFELLAIAPVLKEYSNRVKLTIITNDCKALSSWPCVQRKSFDELLARVPHAIVPYQSISQLLQFYSNTPGVIISPRFLDNSYNASHTEWKITLGMACGRVVLASPQRSYRTVAARASGGIRVCSTPGDWQGSLDELLEPSFDWKAEEDAAVEVVRKYYASHVVAAEHKKCLDQIWRRQSYA